MGTLQKEFEKLLQDSFTFPVVGAKLIKRHLEKKGVVLTDNQIVELEKKLQDINGDVIKFNLDLDDEQSELLEGGDGESVEIDIGGEEEFDEYYQEYLAKLKEFVPEIVEAMTEPIWSGLMEDMPSTLKAHREYMKGFEKRLRGDWKRPFDLFESFLILAFEAGDEFNHEFRNAKREEEKYVLDTLTRLHARACQIASEVFVLLRSGFADGAHARWRSLHEISVVASFIKTHGDEVAERYLLHDIIESYRAALLHKKHYEALGVEPIDKDEFDELKATRDTLIERFGTSYKNPYGWASSALEKDNPNFRDIEKKAKLDHLRPYYKLASHNVHANPKGIVFKLGLLDGQDILLAGPSNYGFTDPAHGTAISLELVTITLLTAKPTIDNLVLINVLSRLEAEIGDEFLRVQKEVEDQYRSLQQKKTIRKNEHCA